jgi:hypothetical protein
VYGISSAVDGIYDDDDDDDDDMLWNDSEEDGNVRSVRKMKALTARW